MENKAPLIILTAQRAWVYRKYPPFGVMYVAQSLSEAGFRVKIVHPVQDRPREVMEALRQERPLFLGLSVIHTPLLKEDIEISRAARAGGVPVVWGGIYPSMVPETALRAEYVDYVVAGEAEATAVELARALQAGERPEKIPGVGFKDRGELVINPCPRFHDRLDDFRPAWELIRLPEYLDIYAGGAGRLAMVPLSRGCPFACTFCYNQSSPERRRYRIHGIDWVRGQLAYLRDKAAINMVRWIGDNPFGHMRQGKETIAAAGMPWVSAARIESMDEDFCEWLRENKCLYLGFGFESGSDKVLAILNKGFNREQMARGIKNLDRVGIDASASWIHLIPGETDQDRQETRQFMDELHRMSGRLFHDLQGLRPYPGTPIWKKCLDMGMTPPTTNEQWAAYTSLVAPLLGWTEERLRRLITLTRLLYGRVRSAPPIVSPWQYALLRRRFLAGKFRAPLEEYLEKRPRLRTYLVDN